MPSIHQLSVAYAINTYAIKGYREKLKNPNLSDKERAEYTSYLEQSLQYLFARPELYFAHLEVQEQEAKEAQKAGSYVSRINLDTYTPA